MQAIQRTTAVPELQIVNGQPVALSTEVATHFGKRHGTVLRKIRALEITDSYRERNFVSTIVEVETPGGGVRKDPAYRMTKDGFVFLVMGFTGAKASVFKIAYIEAFNKMERELREAQLPTARMLGATVIERDRYVLPVRGIGSLSDAPKIEREAEWEHSQTAWLLDELKAKGHEVSGVLNEVMGLRYRTNAYAEALTKLKGHGYR